VLHSAAPQKEDVLVAGHAIAAWIREVAQHIFLYPAMCYSSPPIRIVAEKKSR
jgi:hypothetical protein